MAFPSIQFARLNYPDDFEAFYRALYGVYATSFRGDLPIDLSWCSFIAVPGHMALMTGSRLWHSLTHKSLCLTNVAPDVHAYIERMDILNQCASSLTIDRQLNDDERFDRSSKTTNLLEATRIASDVKQNEEDVTGVIRQAKRILESWYYDSKQVREVLDMLTAVAENIIHSHDTGYVMIQRYRNKGVVVAIADAGIGIRKSLAPHLSEDKLKQFRGSEYIGHALEVGVTSRAGAGGLGLTQVLHRVRGWHGQLSIRSETSRLDITPSNTKPYRYDDLVEVPGTQIIIQIGGP